MAKFTYDGKINQLKDGRYSSRIMLGYGPDNKRVRMTFYGNTPRDVSKQIEEARVKFRNGSLVADTDWLFGDWVHHWLETYSRIKVQRVTYENYVGIAEKHIIPTLGKIKLSKLETGQIQALLNTKLNSGKGDGSGLSTTMVNRIALICNMALERAVTDGLISRNVVIRTVKPPVRHKEVVPLSKVQVEALLKELIHHRLWAFYYLLAATGMRRGECLGLRWDDIDLDNNLLSIRRSLVKTNTGFYEGFGKTKYARRSIPLHIVTVRLLREYLERQLAEKEAAGDKYLDEGRVFCRSNGQALHPDSLINPLRRAAKRVGKNTPMPSVKLHDLRHTFASLLLANGRHPKVVQELLGHSEISITMDIYSHLTPGMKESAIEQISFDV